MPLVQARLPLQVDCAQHTWLAPPQAGPPLVVPVPAPVPIPVDPLELVPLTVAPLVPEADPVVPGPALLAVLVPLATAPLAWQTPD